ncbi:MAG TPA: hypothetical protein VE153_22775 [Myxococcus sp.]|nr:hypothetical protein [Myxococcus sp.]
MFRDTLFAAGALQASQRRWPRVLPLALLVAGAWALAGCNSDDPRPPEDPPGTDTRPDAGSGSDAGTPDGGSSCVTCDDPDRCGAPAQTAPCALAGAGGFCSADCWCWEAPLPHGNSIQNAHFRASNDGWAVGPGGFAQHWDGTRWTRVPTGTRAALNGVHAVSATDVWAVGGFGTVLRSTGGAFAAVDAGTVHTLTSVWASGPDDVWAVGDVGTAVRYRGGGFQPVSTGAFQQLNDVWGSGPNDVWMVGNRGTLRRYDGNTVSSIDAGTTLPLFAVTGTGPNDVWSVTAEDPCFTCDDYGIVYRVSTNGLEERLRLSDMFFDVFAASPSMVLVSGEGPRYRWDGAAWQRLTARGDGFLAGSGPDDVWLFNPNGEVERWNGSAWSRVREFFSGAYDVHGTSAEDVWAVSANGLLRRNGGTWSGVDLGNPLTNSERLTGVYAASPSAVWVVSAEDFSVTNGRIRRWNGSSTSQEHVLEGQVLHAVHGSSASDVWAVGKGGAAVHRDGAGWTSIPTGVTTTLYDVWVQGPSLAVAVGDSGTIQLWNGSAWSAMTSGTRVPLNSVWGSGPTDIWAAGASGTLLHFDGTRWSPACSGTTASLSAVWGVSSSAVWAAGSNGTLLRFDGTKWRPERTDTLRSFGGLWAASASDIWVGGDSSLLHKR